MVRGATAEGGETDAPQGGNNDRHLRRRDRPRNDRHAIHAVRPRRSGRCQCLRKTRTDVSGTGVGRTRPPRNLGEHTTRRHDRARRRGRFRRPVGSYRHHEPARDDSTVGRGFGQTDSQRHRLARPPNHRPHRASRRGGQSRDGSVEDGARTGRLLLGDESRMVARQRRPNQTPARPTAGRSGTCGGGRNPLWHYRLVADLQPDRRAHHGRDERLADDAVRHPRDGVGRRVVRRVRGSERDASGGQTVERRRDLRLDRPGRFPRRGGSGRRSLRRPAGRPVRADLFRRGRREEYVWNG